MRQLIEDAFRNSRAVIDKASVHHRIVGNDDESIFARGMSTKGIFATVRTSTVSVMFAFAALAWAPQSFASPDPQRTQIRIDGDAQRIEGDTGAVRPAGARASEPAQTGGAARNPTRLAQATQGEPENSQKADQEHRRADSLTQQLSIMRRVEMLLTLQNARAEAARFNQSSAGDHAEARKDQQQKNDQLRQEAESGAAELCRALLPANRADQPEPLVAELQASLQRERSRVASLQEAATKCDAAIQASSAIKTNQAAPPANGAAASNGELNELKKSLQKERERSAGLEKDVAAARHDLDAQTALAAKASEETKQAKAAADADAAELKKSLQQERERSAGLEKDVTAARHDLGAQMALVARASEETKRAKAAAEADAAELKKSLLQARERSEQLEKGAAAAQETEAKTTEIHQLRESEAAALQKSLKREQERSERLERDLVAARSDVEAQASLTSKANDNITALKQAVDNGSARFEEALQRERSRAETLSKDLSMMHTAIYTYEVQARIASEQAAARPTASSAAEPARSSQQEQEGVSRLQQTLAVMQRELETQTAAAAQASADSARLKQAAEGRSAELLKSLQLERDKTAALERELAAGRTRNAGASGAGSTEPVVRGQAIAAVAQRNSEPDPANAVDAARLVARASMLLGQGDIGSARIVLQRAVETGSAQASFALAETYDPLVLRKWGALGTLGDSAKAREFYARAQAAGIEEARERVEALNR